MFICVNLWILSVAFCGSAFAEKASNEAGISFDFDQTEITSFIKVVSELTGKNFVIDKDVRGKITVISPETVPRAQVFSVFESILRVYGYAVVQAGTVYHVIPLANAKTEGLPILGSGQMPADTSALVTQLIPLHYTDAREVANVFRSMVSKDAAVLAHEPSNTIIVSDTAGNVRRMLQIARQLDTKEGGRKVFTFPLTHASAEAVASKIEEVFKVSAGPAFPGRKELATGQEVRAVADLRTNTVIVVGEPQLEEALADLLATLDAPEAFGQRSLHVYYLQHARAADLAKVLADQLQFTSLDKPQQQGAQPASPVRVTPDPATNSLVVSATPQEYELLSETIKNLDVPRERILVEVLMAEVSQDATRELGVEWRLTDTVEPDGYTGIGGTSLPTGTGTSALAQTAVNPYNPPSGLILGLVKGTVTFNGQEFFNLAALARAFEGTTQVNLLSTPHILTTDNEEAEIIVGEERPFLQSSQITSNDAVIRSFEYRDVGITLRLTPHISQVQDLRLDLFVEVKDFLEQSELGAITTTKRQAKTTVQVENGQMAIIGGLLQRNRQVREGMVPCLGKVPLMGWLFKSARASQRHTNLLIFMTPHVLTSAEDLRQTTEEKQKTLPEQEGEDSLLERGLGK